jgi:hypothetical protein
VRGRGSRSDRRKRRPCRRKSASRIGPARLRRKLGCEHERSDGKQHRHCGRNDGALAKSRRNTGQRNECERDPAGHADNARSRSGNSRSERKLKSDDEARRNLHLEAEQECKQLAHWFGSRFSARPQLVSAARGINQRDKYAEKSRSSESFHALFPCKLEARFERSHIFRIDHHALDDAIVDRNDHGRTDHIVWSLDQ